MGMLHRVKMPCYSSLNAYCFLSLQPRLGGKHVAIVALGAILSHLLVSSRLLGCGQYTERVHLAEDTQYPCVLLVNALAPTVRIPVRAGAGAMEAQPTYCEVR